MGRRCLQGNFGVTFHSQAPVRHEFVRRFPASFELVSLSLVISAVFGIGFGILSALYRNSMLDYIVRVFAVFGASIPDFFLLTLLIIIPSYLFNYAAPIGGYHSLFHQPMPNLRQFGPPALVLGIGGSAALMRLVRTTMLEVLRADYIRTAQAKGLSRWTIVLTHAFRNAATPIVTALGTAFIAVFGGSVIAETIMSIDGVGAFFFASTLSRDLPVIQFLAVYTAAVVIIVNLRDRPLVRRHRSPREVQLMATATARRCRVRTPTTGRRCAAPRGTPAGATSPRRIRSASSH